MKRKDVREERREEVAGKTAEGVMRKEVVMGGRK